MGDDEKLTAIVERGAIFYKQGIPDGKGDDDSGRDPANVRF